MPAAAPPLGAGPAGESGAEGASDERVLLPSPSPRPHWAGDDGQSGSLSSQRWQSRLAGRRRSCGAGRGRWLASRTSPEPINVQIRRDARSSSAPSPAGSLTLREATPSSCKLQSSGSSRVILMLSGFPRAEDVGLGPCDHGEVSSTRNGETSARFAWDERNGFGFS